MAHRYDFSFDLSTSEATGWVFLNKQENIASKSHIVVNWANATGTLTGLLETQLLVSNFGLTTTLDDISVVVDAKQVDSASGSHSVVVNALHSGVRVKYTANDITGGSLVGSILMEA